LVYGMGPVDLLQLRVVHREVAGGVEELLRLDRRPQPHPGERQHLAGLADRGGHAAALEELPRRADRQLDDLVALDPADPSLVECHQSHARLVFTGSFSLYESLFHSGKSSVAEAGVSRAPGAATRNTRSCRASVE